MFYLFLRLYALSVLMLLAAVLADCIYDVIIVALCKTKRSDHWINRLTLVRADKRY